MVAVAKTDVVQSEGLHFEGLLMRDVLPPRKIGGTTNISGS